MLTPQEIYQQPQLWRDLARTTYDLQLLEALWQRILQHQDPLEKNRLDKQFVDVL